MRLPPSLVDPRLLLGVDQVAIEVLGRADRTGSALAEQVAQLSETYTRSRSEIASRASGKGAMAARLRFFLPRDLPKIGKPLAELADADALPKRRPWRILDIGAGLGATSLGAACFGMARGLSDRFEILALDRDAEGLRIFERLAQVLDRDLIGQIALEARGIDVSKIDPRQLGGPFDLVLVGLALNEMYAAESDPAETTKKRANLLLRLSELAPEGSVIAIEPALRETSRALHHVRDHIAGRDQGPFVFAPCIRRGPCPALLDERDWCHEELPFALPDELVPIAREAGLRASGLGFSYLTLRSDGKRLRAHNEQGLVPLRVVSDPLPSKGKHELFVCGDEGRVRVTRLDREISAANAAFSEAARGDWMSIRDRDARGRIARDSTVYVHTFPIRRG